MIRSLIAIFSLLHLAACESVSLAQASAFASQRPCAQSCFGGGIFGDVGELADGIGCAYQNPQNECVCRLDLQSNADEYIASCVSRYCSANTLDITSAVSIYDSYCTSAGYVRDTPATATSADSSTSAPSSLASSPSQPQQTSFTSQTSSLASSNSVEDSSSRTGPSETEAPAPTDSTSGSGSNEGEESNGGSNNNGGGNGLGVGDIVGIVVGVLGFIATAIGTWFTYKSIMKKKPSRYSQHGERGWGWR
ncbi:hypothetical protein F5Y09DRAFT_92005 [Xylaria sp. FL1042]|nr:hypothetical protein F5Y09DRAFT_92005 [Xylaria sp. FL1042]